MGYGKNYIYIIEKECYIFLTILLCIVHKIGLKHDVKMNACLI